MSANTFNPENSIDWVEVSKEEYYSFLADKYVSYIPEGEGMTKKRYYIPKNRLAEIRKAA